MLFEQICDLPEYYVTRTERAILEQRADELAARSPAGVSLVELGSGSAAKTRLLIRAFLERLGSLRYVPIDASCTMLEQSSLELVREFAALHVVAIAGEYHEGLRELRDRVKGPKLLLWLGSSIGNLDLPDAEDFLAQVRDTMARSDRMLVGIDLRKHRAVLEPAYDDAQGVTARFNLNLLARINRELGGHFDLATFRHRAVYNEAIGRIEMYLVNTCQQRVAIDDLNLEIEFAEHETIHTENSYKYSIESIAQLAGASGFAIEAQWLDAAARFSVNLFAPSAIG